MQILDTTSYAGAGALMALESMIAPVPSEAVMPFVGFQVADGKWNFGLAMLATSAGSIVGSLLSYFMGYYGGKPVVLEGENSPHAKSIYDFARKVVERVSEIKAASPGNVIQIQ